MNKKLILLPACLLMLTACNNGGSFDMPSIAPSVSNVPSEVPSVVPPSIPDTPSVVPSTSTPEDEGTPASRHANYLAICNTDSSATVTIRVKVLGYQNYSDSQNGNYYFQEDKYGYFINNIPRNLLEVGKSYQITAENYYGEFAKSYPCLKYYGKTWECQEIADVAITPYVLGETTTDTSSQEYKDGQYSHISLGGKTATVTAVDLSSNYPSFSFTLDGDTSGTTYKWNSNSGVAQWSAIAAKLADLKVGDKLHKIEGGWGGNYSGAKATDVMGTSFEQVGANPTSITITGDTGVQVNQEKQLTATLAPKHAIEDVEWTTSDAGVVTVSQTGLITGVATGSATITVKSLVDATVQQTYNITVSDSVAPTAITIDGPASVSLTNTANYTVESVTPTNANADVTWVSSNTAVASIDENGLLKGLSVGTTQVTAVSTLDNTVVSNAITVEVTGLSLPLTGMFDNVVSEKVIMPEGWDADPYDSPYGYNGGGMKCTSSDIIIKSPKFVAVDSVEVGLIISKLNKNTKNNAGEDPFKVEALGENGSVIDSTTIATLVAGQTATATVSGTGIVQIRVTYQDYAFDASGCYNTNLGGITLTEANA